MNWSTFVLSTTSIRILGKKGLDGFLEDDLEQLVLAAGNSEAER
ncbi:MAG: hypothetical protein R2787_17515 [Saprospiraceae bacterium]